MNIVKRIWLGLNEYIMVLRNENFSQENLTTLKHT